MKKVNTIYWKEYRVGDLFEFQRGKVKKLQSLEEGNIPVIAAARSKQGVAGYYTVEGIYIDQITISCNGVGCGSTFYHDYPFNVNGDAIVSFDKVYIPAKAKQFISCILDGVLSRKYSYEEKCSPEKASNEIILLPSTSDGSPDWQYMEDYMRCIEQQTKTAISAFVSSKHRPSKIDTRYWKEFEIENLFDVSRPPARLATEFEEGTIPFIASGNENNGVEKYVAAKNDILDKKGCISVSPVDGSCFYQPNDFLGRGGAGSSIILLRNSNLNQYSALFVCSSLRKVCSKYNYSNMGSASKIKKEKILLPATPAGEPDWKYMEMYMRGAEAITKEKISLLTKKKQEIQQAPNELKIVGGNITYNDYSTTYNVKNNA